jgi:hypothetical protein
VGIQFLRQLQANSPVRIGCAPALAQPPVVFDGSVFHTLAYIVAESSEAALVAKMLLLTFVLLNGSASPEAARGGVLSGAALCHRLLPLVVAEIVQTRCTTHRSCSIQAPGWHPRPIRC